MPDFLINLIKNKPHENLTPTENFLTEVLAYALNNKKKFREKFINLLKGKLLKGKLESKFLGRCFDLKEELMKHWKTQYTLANGKRPDLVCTSSDPHVYIEVKVWAPLHEGQIQSYRTANNPLVGMICASETVNTQNADFVITWSEIESLMGKKSLFFTQFRKLLAFEELASSSLENFGDLYISMRVASLIKELKDHFRKLDLKNKAAHLLPFESCELYDRDGIYGIRWAQEKYKQDPRWRPSVFAGLLLDPYDHRLDDIYRSSPLPFILSISINMDLYPHLQKISEWKAFTERLQYVEKNNDWKFLDRSLEGSPNKWHPFILYKPLETFIDHNTPNLDLWEGIIKCLEQTLPEVKKAFQDTKIEEALTQKLKDLGKL